MTRAKRLSALAVTGAMLLAGASAPASHADDTSTPSPVVTVESEAAGNAAATETTPTAEAITPNPTAEEAPSENLDPSGTPSEELVADSSDSTEIPAENPILKEAPYAGMMSVSTIPITNNPGQTELGYQLGQLAPTEAPYRFSVLSFAWETSSGTPATFAYRTQSDGYWGDWQILMATEELSFTDQVIVSASSALEVIVFGETESAVTGLKAVLTAFPEGEAPTAQPPTSMFRTFSAAPALYSSGETQQQFIDRIAPLAQEDEKKWKVPASVSMAQAILESGWGKSTLTTQYHNYFGIKCWAGQTSTYPTGCVDMATGEYYGGAYVTITAGFRVYANAQDSFMDHGQFLNVNSRYAPAFSTTSSDAFARAIHAAGYATSPTYSDSLINLMKIYNLYQYDGSAVSVPSKPAPANISGAIVGVGHVQNIGWQEWVTEGQTIGTTGRGLHLEAIQLDNLSVTVRPHVQDLGWTTPVSKGEVAGTTGKSLRLEALTVASGVSGWGIECRAYVRTIGWMNWVSDGQVCGTTGKSLPLEAIQLRLTPVSAEAVVGSGHVQDIGWQGNVTRGQTLGTTGRSLRLEAVKLGNMPVTARPHVENLGWTASASQGEIVGTTGKSLRLEALTLTSGVSGWGIECRAHVENIGWMDWVGDGKVCGTTGKSLRLEAIQLRLVQR